VVNRSDQIERTHIEGNGTDDARPEGTYTDDGCDVHVDNRSDQVHALDHKRDAMLALIGLGFAKGIASRAIAAALECEPASLEQLVRAALRHCAKPSA